METKSTVPGGGPPYLPFDGAKRSRWGFRTPADEIDARERVLDYMLGKGLNYCMEHREFMRDIED